MSKPVRLLPDSISNKIAAGEVVEDPASVIKELVENAIDAGSTKVSVETIGAGLKSIKVSDNGHGMGIDDAKRCLLRHATSKIQEADDLFNIVTMGFRGEALSSIAAVSEMTLTTALTNGNGIELEVQGGKISSEKKVARAQGTTITVRSLFCSVPARKKFQKSPAALSAAIFKLMTSLSLAHPDVQLKLFNGDKEQLISKGTGELRSKVGFVLGEALAKRGHLIESQEGALGIEGMISSPLDTKPNRTGQWLFLNRRPILCPEIREAIYAGYGTRLQERRHPLFVLHLQLPPHLVDVNVHPQKLHVRLKEPEVIARFVEKAISTSFHSAKKPIFTPPQEPIQYAPIEPEAPAVLQEEVEPQFLWTPPSFSARFLYGPFLFVEEEMELFVVDLKKAKARILFEGLLGKQNRGVEKQGLLFPLTIELDQIETAMLLTHMAAIEKMGFSVTFLGGQTFSVDALPTFLSENQAREVLIAMGQSLQEFIGKEDYEERRERKLAQTAVRFAKQTTFATLEVASEVYGKLLELDESNLCPSGLPIKGRIDHATIEMLINQNPKLTATAQES